MVKKYDKEVDEEESPDTPKKYLSRKPWWNQKNGDPDLYYHVEELAGDKKIIIFIDLSEMDHPKDFSGVEKYAQKIEEDGSRHSTNEHRTLGAFVKYNNWAESNKTKTLDRFLEG